ncbi:MULTISPECIES: ATP-binding protein [Aeromonas]|uniref:ATP-binding protein n=1 Tax=Aeromonas TaxID=642 RepID=UPI0012F3B271|nr:ATP-binding protein [Aeromonas salmonicida]VXA79683.1 putative Signal transduction histidine kinase [Aeromonas salmonicida]
MLIFQQAHLRQYLRFYAFWLISVVVLAALAQALIDKTLRDNQRAYMQGLLRGTELLIEDRLTLAPASHWPRLVAELDRHFHYNLRLLPLEQKQAIFRPDEYQALLSGQSVITDEGDVLYRLLPDKLTLAAIGPLSYSVNPEYAAAFRQEILTKMTIWGLAALLLGGAAWWWLRPLQLDARSLRTTAKLLGEGKLGCRVAPARSELFSPLVATMNSMAERVQYLIAAHKEMSSMISHELRTPLARIRFTVGILQELDDPEAMSGYFERIENDLTELDELVQAALVFGRFDRDDVAFRPEVHVLAPWLYEVIENLESLANGVQIEVGDIPAGCSAYFDAKLMKYAVSNIVRNACKYATSRVSLTVFLQQDMANIIVDDDGPGIPVGERAKILQPYTRFLREQARSNVGFGLGLTIANRIIVLHGGHIDITDSALGGARFALIWPVTSKTQ